MLILKNLTASEIRSVLASHRSCVFSAKGCLLESKTGRLVINLDPKCDRIVLQGRRLSGNGKVLLETGTKTIKLAYTSKVSQELSVEVTTNETLTISRPSEGLGEVELTGITFLSKGDVLSNWKAIMKSCGNYRCLRVTSGRLFAGEGAFIEGAKNIKSVQTDPPNCAKIQDEKIIFLRTCEIVAMELNGHVVAPSQKDLYPDRQAPPSLAPQSPAPVLNRFPPVQHPVPKKLQAEPAPNLIKHDTLVSKEFTAVSQINKLVKKLSSNGKHFLALKRGGKYISNISSLEPNTEYVVIIDGKSIAGNGKLVLGLGDAVQANYAEIVLDGAIKERMTRLKTPYVQGDMKLSVALSDGAGECIISRIRVINGVVGGATYQEVAPPMPAIAFPSYTVVSPDVESSDQVYIDSRRFATYNSEKYGRTLDIAGQVRANTDSGLSYLAKIAALVPQVQVGSANGILLSKVGSLEPADRIWLEPFMVAELGSTDLSILRQAKRVLTPSEANLQYLSVMGIKADLRPRPLPYVPPTLPRMLVDQQYAVMFNRSASMTSFVVKNWNPTWPKLVVLGARGQYPEHVIPFNEYCSYSQILGITLNSNFCVDLHRHNTDYCSGFGELLTQAGMPMISNNSGLLNSEVTEMALNNSSGFPSWNYLADLIEQKFSQTVNLRNMENYNTKFCQQLQALL